ncbi:MAG TPA: rod shape-determining protein MreD [Rhodospirillaceae bacterium]|nr:rod shape-determining protein MreD [Rhodospirillaceae bacterium]
MKGSLWKRMDLWVRQILPAGSTLLLILVNVMPTRLPGFAPVAPLLPLISVYYWAVYRPELLPPPVAFGLGLLTDIIAGTPLGVSPLVYLLLLGMTSSQRRIFSGRSFLVAWWGFILMGTACMVLQWGLVSLVFGQALEFRSVLFELLMTLSFYPLVSWLFARAQLALLKRA